MRIDGMGMMASAVMPVSGYAAAAVAGLLATAVAGT
jgi:hypothetical protein